MGAHKLNRDDMGCIFRFRKEKKIELGFTSKMSIFKWGEVLDWVCLRKGGVQIKSRMGDKEAWM